MVWDATIAFYLFLAGLGAGAFSLAAILSFVKPELKMVRKVGYLIAPIAVVVGCLLLMVDARGGLLNPNRFFYIVSNLQSVMSWGVMILTVFILLTAVNLVLFIRKGKTPRGLDLAGIVLSVCVAAYTGLLLGAANAFPLWNPFVLPVLFIVSAFSSGFAAVLLIAYIMKSNEPSQIGFTKKTALVFPVVEGILIAVLLVVVSFDGGSTAQAAKASVANLLSGSYAAVFWIGLVLIGIVFPFGAEIYSKRFMATQSGNDNATTKVALAVVTESCVVVGAFALRFLVIMAAVPTFM